MSVWRREGRRHNPHPEIRLVVFCSVAIKLMAKLFFFPAIGSRFLKRTLSLRRPLPIHVKKIKGNQIARGASPLCQFMSVTFRRGVHEIGREGGEGGKLLEKLEGKVQGCSWSTSHVWSLTV